MTKRFHLADDNEIEEILLNKDSINTKKSMKETIQNSPKLWPGGIKHSFPLDTLN